MITALLNTIKKTFCENGFDAFIAEEVRDGDSTKILFDGKDWGGVVDNKCDYIYLKKSGEFRVVDVKGCPGGIETQESTRITLIAHGNQQNLLQIVRRLLHSVKSCGGNGIRNWSIVPVSFSDNWRKIFESENNCLPKQFVNVAKIEFDLLFSYRDLPAECDLCC